MKPDPIDNLPPIHRPVGAHLSPYDHDLVAAAIDGLDAVAKDHERRWGINQLRVAVDDLLRARFDRQCRKLDAVLWDGASPAADILAQIEATKRGWRAMEQAALAAGRQPMPANWIECPLTNGGSVIIVDRHGPETEGLRAAAGTARMVMTREEAGRLLAAVIDPVAAVVTAFPGAEVTAVRSTRPAANELNDELPW